MRDKFTFSHRTNKDISYLFTKRISFLEIYLGNTETKMCYIPKLYTYRIRVNEQYSKFSSHPCMYFSCERCTSRVFMKISTYSILDTSMTTGVNEGFISVYFF